MRNPWWQFCILRGPLQALPSSWWIALGWWLTVLILQGVIDTVAPQPSRFGYLDSSIETTAEIALAAAILAAFRRGDMFLQTWQALSMGDIVRMITFLPLAWLYVQAPTLSSGAMLLYSGGVLLITLAALAWIVPYYFRLWKQALAVSSNKVISLVMIGVLVVMGGLSFWLRPSGVSP